MEIDRSTAHHKTIVSNKPPKSIYFDIAHIVAHNHQHLYQKVFHKPEAQIEITQPICRTQGQRQHDLYKSMKRAEQLDL